MEEGMTATKKSPADEQLDRIEDALIETTLNSSEAELREDMKARGEDPDKCLAEIDSLIARAKTDAAKRYALSSKRSGSAIPSSRPRC